MVSQKNTADSDIRHEWNTNTKIVYKCYPYRYIKYTVQITGRDVAWDNAEEEEMRPERDDNFNLKAPGVQVTMNNQRCGS